MYKYELLFIRLGLYLALIISALSCNWLNDHSMQRELLCFAPLLIVSIIAITFLECLAWRLRRSERILDAIV